MRWWALVLLAGAGLARGEETLNVCYNYGCASEEAVVVAENQLAWLREMMSRAQTPEAEREMLALVVGRFYAWSGEQTPVWRDRGGNQGDDGQDGAMDCIDHAMTTTRFLEMLARRSWLRFHRVAPVERRLLFFVLQHFSAAVEELGPLRDPLHPSPERYVVDSWLRDNGEPAVILPLEAWREGAGEEE